MNKLITTSIDCKESAKRIANQILSDRLSPCVQIINNINSFYIWNNQIEESIEFLIIIKCIHENQNDITAIFATADIIALGLFSAFYENNVKVPQQISIVGFDNTFLAKTSVPPLTTVNQNIKNKAVISARTLLNILKDIEIKEKTTILPVEVVERSSVKEVI